MLRKSISVVAVLVFAVALGCGKRGDTGESAEETPILIPTTINVTDAFGTELRAGVSIYPADSKERIADGFAGQPFEIEEGKYDFLIQYNGGEKLFKGREVKGDEAVFDLTIPTGILTVRCFSSGGEEIEAEVLIYPSGFEGDIPAYRADVGEEITTIPGNYEVAVSTQGTLLPRKSVTIEKDTVTNESFILDTGYIVVNLVDYGGNPVPGEVRVYPAGDYNSSIAAGLTGEKIAVRPGSYDVVATADRYSERSAGITVLTNQISEEKLVTYRYEVGKDE